MPDRAPNRRRRTKSPPAEQARLWWKERVEASRYVVPPAEAPSAAVAKILRHDGLVYEAAGRRAWILTAERPTDGRALFLANYWPVVGLVLDHYAPAVIVGLDAVRLYLGDFAPPREIRVNHAANKSDYDINLDAEFYLRVRPRVVPATRIMRIVAPGDTKLPTLAPADLLLTLDEVEIAAGIEPISAWLRHLALREADLREAVEESPRPFILQRLADLAEGLGNAPLERLLDAAALRTSPHSARPARTGVGTRIEVPSVLAAARPEAGSPWLDAQAMRLTRQEQEVKTVIGADAAALPIFPLRRLVAKALQSKAFDAYHNTTMEGYRISPEVAEAIVRGDARADGPQDRRSFEAAMAIQGYSNAFDQVLDLAASHAPLTAGVILDLYEALYRPSIEANLVEPHDLRRWRNGAVALRGWRHVPPNHRKIDDLIGGLVAFSAREDLPAVARAILVHLEFVTVHPFYDGNGRLGRLLMNLALVSAGHPWVTIRADEREPFFRSIERAQVEDDTKPLIEFLWHLIRRAASDMASTTTISRRTRSRR